MWRDVSNTLIIRGLVAIAIGIIAIVWPDITVDAFVIVFAIFAFTDAIWQGVRAFSSVTAGPVVGHLLLALLDVAAGVVALVWPDITAYVLVICVGIWAVVTGVVEFAAAFIKGETAGERAMLGAAGIASILLGIVLFAYPHAGAITLALVFGFFCLVFGFVQLALGIDSRRTGGSTFPAAQRPAPA
jgi:uncharacterized membrane protein HdeD (DUF308 family)